MPAVLDGDGDKIPIDYPAMRGSSGRVRPDPNLQMPQAERLSTAIDTPAPMVELNDTFFT